VIGKEEGVPNDLPAIEEEANGGCAACSAGAIVGTTTYDGSGGMYELW
jgi:hypothetical protein